jgi:hypothetical protein
MEDAAVAPLARGMFRATITGVGRLGPIEERLGFRLVRLVDPESKEGQTLVRTRQVSVFGPQGTALGRVDLNEARRLLERRLQSLLSDLEETESVEALRDCLVRLRRAGPRDGRT